MRRQVSPADGKDRIGLRTIIVEEGIPIHTARGGHPQLGTFQGSCCSSYIRCSLLGLLLWQGVCKAQVLQEVPAHTSSPSPQHQQCTRATCQETACRPLPGRLVLSHGCFHAAQELQQACWRRRRCWHANVYTELLPQLQSRCGLGRGQHVACQHLASSCAMQHLPAGLGLLRRHMTAASAHARGKQHGFWHRPPHPRQAAEVAMIQSGEVNTCVARLATEQPHTPQLTST